MAVKGCAASRRGGGVKGSNLNDSNKMKVLVEEKPATSICVSATAPAIPSVPNHVECVIRQVDSGA